MPDQTGIGDGKSALGERVVSGLRDLLLLSIPLLFLLIVWIFVAALCELGPYQAIRLFLRFIKPFAFGVVIWVWATGITPWILLKVPGIQKIRPQSIIVDAGVAFIAWLIWTDIVGSHSRIVDWFSVLSVLALSIPAMLYLHKNISHRFLLPRGIDLLCVFLATTLMWVVTSVADEMYEASRASRTVATNAKRSQATAPSRLRIGLALSGGGYRAALFHAGVLDELSKVLAEVDADVTNISSVSGGSLIGSYVAAGGDPSKFLQVFDRNGLNLYRALTNFRNAVRLPFPALLPFVDVKLLPGYQFSRTDAQAELIERELTGKTRFRDLKGAQTELMICATDLLTGEGIGVTGEGVLLYPPITAEQKHHYENVPAESATPRFLPSAVVRFDGDPTIARFVAGSGAFPIAFPPVRLEFENTQTHTSRTLALADGGLVDNQAINLIFAMRRAATTGQEGELWNMDVVIASDAGEETSPVNLDPARLLDSAESALDIVYSNVGMDRGGSSLSSWLLKPRRLLRNPDLLHYLSAKPCRAEVPDPILDIHEELKSISDALQTGELSQLEDLSSPNLTQAERDRIWHDNSRSVAEALCTFNRTGTLQNSVTPEEAQRLFSLGTYVVLYEWPAIYKKLSSLKASRDHTVQ